MNNSEINNAKDIDIVMPVYDLIGYSDSYFKTFGSLWQYYKDELIDNLADSESFKSKVKITKNAPVDSNAKDAEIIVPLKYLSNFLETVENSFINKAIY